MLFRKHYSLMENGFCDGRIELSYREFRNREFNEDAVLFL